MTTRLSPVMSFELLRERERGELGVIFDSSVEFLLFSFKLCIIF